MTEKRSRLSALLPASVLVAGLVVVLLWLRGQGDATSPEGATGEDARAQSGTTTAGTETALRFSLPAAPSPRYDRVVLVTIDTLRPDHLQSYGYRRQTSPFCDRLAAEGALFENTLATVSHTSPSHASLMTGLPPALHGVMLNGERLAEHVPTAAELFGAAGFETAGFSSVNFLGGVTKGFETASSINGKGQATTERALEWLNDPARGARFFLWVHYYDVHGWGNKARLPEEYFRFIEESSPLAPEDSYEYVARLHGMPAAPAGAEFEPPRWQDDQLAPPSTREEFVGWIDSYDAGIAYVDRQVERLFETIEALEPAQAPDSATLWIITSDHGEGLGGHDYSGHGDRIYNEQLRVPLVLWASDGSVRGRFTELVSHLDLLPTFADLLGGTLVGDDAYREGDSLVDLWEGRESASESNWGQRSHFAQRRPVDERYAGSEQQEMYAVQTATHKYLVSFPGGEEFYDLAADPLELVDLRDRALPAMDELKRRLAERRAFYGAHTPASTDLADAPPEWLDELRALGYIR